MRIKLNVKSKVAAIFAAMGILLAICVGAVSYSLSYRQVAAQYTGMALSSAQMAAALVEGDEIADYLSGGENEAYRAAYRSLQDLKMAYDIVYLYIVKPDTARNDGVYVFDVYTEGNDYSLIAELGEPTGEMDVYDIILNTYLTGGSTDNAVITDSEFGHLASAYAPVYARDGTVSAVAGADMSMDFILRDVRAQTLRISGAVFAVVVLFLVILLFAVQRGVLDPIVKLSRHMEGFNSEDGKLQSVAVVRSGDELQTMAESFNRMLHDMRLYMANLAAVTADRERIATELDVATRIQASMLPSIFPAFPDREEFDLYASMQPAKEVGGDFYDFFLVDENTLAVVMADVSGKGVPAALFMVIAKTLIKNNAQKPAYGGSGKSPKDVFETVNDLLCENNEADMFVTAVLGYLDIPTGKFTYVNAGHNPPLISAAMSLVNAGTPPVDAAMPLSGELKNENGELHASHEGQFEWLKTKPGFVLAGIDGTPYKQHEITLRPGDRLFLYTDGVTEAANNDNEMFSEQRLLEAANNGLGLSPREFAMSIKDEIDKFAEGAEQADDITMLVLRYKGPPVAGNGERKTDSSLISAEELVVEAKIENIDAVMDFVNGRLDGCSTKTQNQINIAVDEIFSNIAHYAYSPKVGVATVRIAVGDYITLEFEDSGMAYDPIAKDDPDISLSPEDRDVGGLGIFMVKNIMDSAEYRREGSKNILTLKLSRGRCQGDADKGPRGRFS